MARNDSPFKHTDNDQQDAQREVGMIERRSHLYKETKRCSGLAFWSGISQAWWSVAATQSVARFSRPFFDFVARTNAFMNFPSTRLCGADDNLRRRMNTARSENDDPFLTSHSFNGQSHRIEPMACLSQGWYMEIVF